MIKFAEIPNDNGYVNDVNSWLADPAQDGIYDYSFCVADNAVFVMYKQNVI